MNVSQTALGLMLLWALAVGGGLGVLYDLLRLTRMLVGWDLPRAPQGQGKPDRARWRIPAGILLFVEDLAFGLICGVALILLLYYTNDGQFRLWAPLGMAVGYGTYTLTVGKLFRLVAEGICRFIRTAVKRVIGLLLWPVRRAGAWIRRTVGTYLRQRVEAYRHRRAEAYTRRWAEDYVGQAAQGFELLRQDEKNQ